MCFNKFIKHCNSEYSLNFYKKIIKTNKNTNSVNQQQVRVICVPVAQWLEHCASSTKVVGSTPREHIY